LSGNLVEDEKIWVQWCTTAPIVQSTNVLFVYLSSWGAQDDRWKNFSNSKELISEKKVYSRITC
jgi:hypothetical protein